MRRMADQLWSLGGMLGVDRVARHIFRKRLLIVCYHGISDLSASQDWLLHPVSRFEEEVRYLSRHYDVLWIDDALRRLKTSGLTRPTAAITFDDGYANILPLALPVLKRYSVPCTIYLPTTLIDNGEFLWTNHLEQALIQTPVSILETGIKEVDGPLGGARSDRTRRARAIKEHLKTIERSQREDIIARAIAQVGEPQNMEDFRLLTPKDIESLDRSGYVSFGGHTCTHQILTRLPDFEVVSEIGESVERVRRFQNVSETFAYPNGRKRDYDVRAVLALKEYGIKWAVTTRPGLNPPSIGSYDLRRLVVAGDMNLSSFVAQASGLGTLLHR